MNTVRINGQDYTSSLTEAELAFIGPLSLPAGIGSLSEGIVKHEEDISELNSNLENKQAKLKSKTVTVTINSGSATGAAGSGVVRSKIISIILCKNDDVYYTPITYSVYDTGSIECRAFTTPTANRSYTFIVWYVD